MTEPAKKTVTKSLDLLKTKNMTGAKKYNMPNIGDLYEHNAAAIPAEKKNSRAILSGLFVIPLNIIK
ncbi:MAG: hypothetical protein AB7V07_06410 [Candidatus Delongbacteria bacterium]|jgi:hypothetical protein